MFDVAVIGTGPAGLSAALNLKLLARELVWFGSARMSGKVDRSEKIANYPGLGLVSGPELNEAFRAHARRMEIAPSDRMVTSVAPLGDRFMLLADNDVVEARAVILATGAVTGKGFPGEARLLGRGVSCCATCDGFLYKGKTIAVFCGDPRYEHEVEYLAGLAEKVYLTAPYKGCAVDLPNVERLPAPIREIRGEERVSAVVTAAGELPVDGVFLLRPAVAPAALLPGLQMDGPHIAVDRAMATSIPGCFAAGDVTGTPYQIAKAVGEGNIAAHSAVAWLAGEAVGAG